MTEEQGQEQPQSYEERARAAAAPDSDLDLFIVYETSLRRDKRARQIKDLFRPYPAPMDIFVYTPVEIAKFSKQEGSFIKEILNTGKVIYERMHSEDEGVNK